MTEAVAAPPRFVAVSLDCADPRELATFYLELLDGAQLWLTAGSAGVRIPGGAVVVAQRVAGYEPPVWPGVAIVHLDLAAGPDLDADVARAVALGASEAQLQPDPRWRILLDPAGHPFCITTVLPPGQ